MVCHQNLTQNLKQQALQELILNMCLSLRFKKFVHTFENIQSFSKVYVFCCN